MSKARFILIAMTISLMFSCTPDAGDEGRVILFDPEEPGNASLKKGYIMYNYMKGKRVFNNDKYYLKALPVAEIVKYADKGYKLTQNPGWE